MALPPGRGALAGAVSAPDHFAAVAAAYAEFRPTYPAALFAWLAERAPGRRLAWDCGTGSGQAARDLAAHFEHVRATDASAAQIEKAERDPRVEYRVEPAERSGLGDRSVDLVTVAQALHWFDRERFFAEVERVVRPYGLLAVWTYGPLRVDVRAVDELVQHFYHEIVGPYWPPERALVDGGYRAVQLPFPELAAPAFEMSARWSLEALLGYLGTWSATRRYLAATGGDPVDLVRDPLGAAWGDPSVPRTVRWPLTVRVGRKPENSAAGVAAGR